MPCHVSAALKRATFSFLAGLIFKKGHKSIGGGVDGECQISTYRMGMHVSYGMDTEVPEKSDLR
jgi:hypothetical protein